MTHDSRYDVFISYSSIDRKVAEGICGFLEANGLRCFIDYRDIPHGALWPRVISDAVMDSEVMVAVFSDNYNRSVQVERELSLTDEKFIPILPFRLSDTPYDRYKLYYFKSLNWIDAFPEPEKVFGTLLNDIRKILDGDSGYNRRRDVEAVHPASAGCVMSPAVGQPDTVDDDCYSDDYDDGVDALRHMEYDEAMDFLLRPALAGYRDSRVLMRRLLKASFIRHGSDEFWGRVRVAADEERNAYAMLMMSRYHGFIDVNHDRAYEYAALSARGGDPFGEMELSMLHGFGAGVVRNPKRFLDGLTALARRNFEPAVWFLAREYIYGFTVRKNVRRGLKLLERGVGLGYAECACELGGLLVRGEVVDADRERGLALLRRAVDSAVPSAVNALAMALFGDPSTRDEGFEMLNDGVRRNNSECVNSLAGIYEARYRAGGNVGWNLVFRWWLRAAALGNRAAMEKIAGHYLSVGDYAGAWEWAQPAALLGSAYGEYCLAELCVLREAPGGHTPQEGMEHYENAVYTGGNGAMLAALAQFLIYAPDGFDDGFPARICGMRCVDGIEKSEERALAALRRGADCGCGICNYYLGCALTDTSRSYSDEIEGVECLHRALSAGRYEAAVRLHALYRDGIGVIADRQKAGQYLAIAREHVPGLAGD